MGRTKDDYYDDVKRMKRRRSHSRERDDRDYKKEDYKKEDYKREDHKSDDYRRRDDKYKERDVKKERSESSHYRSADSNGQAVGSREIKSESVKSEFKEPRPPKKIEPISLEELKEKLKNEELEKNKPRFLTKEQRAAEALKRRQEEADAQRRKVEEEREKRKRFMEEAKRSLREQEDRERDSRRYDRDRRDRYREEADEEGGGGPAAGKEKKQEEEAILERYLGVSKKKKKIRKLNERKFVFDWDAGEDTSTDYNPLYKERHTIQLFGRGHVAGIDLKQQKKEQSKFYGDLMEARRTHSEKEQERSRLEKVKKREEKQKWDDRHWTQKRIDEMTERDWRIFREDYNITIKGSRIPSPLRNWNESELPKVILDIIEENKYFEPTPIQRQAIPIGLQNRDIIGVAETGS